MAHDGDPLAREVLGVIGERLGFGLVGLVNTFNPEVIVIGGGAVRGGRPDPRAGARRDRGARAAADARARCGSCPPTTATRRE